MEELIEGICYGSSDKVVKNAFEKKDKKKEGEEYPYPGVPYGYVPAPGYVPVEGVISGVPPGYVPAPGYAPVPPTEGAVSGVPPGYVPAPGYVPVEGAVSCVPPGYVPAPGYIPVAPAEGAVSGVPPGYVPAPGYVPVATAEGYMLAPGYYPPPPGYILEHQGDGDPAKHHSEKAKEEAIVELRKKKSGSQRLTEKILSWMPGMKI